MRKAQLRTIDKGTNWVMHCEEKRKRGNGD